VVRRVSGMKRRIGLGAFLVAAAALVLTGCFDTLTSPKHENPLDPDNPDTQSRVPGKPTGLSAVVSDRRVVLSWAMSDTSFVASYRVYRWQVVEGEEPGDEDYELLDTVTGRTCTDSGVRNGQEYSYRVAAVNTLGLEGRQSLALSVTPRVYGVSIAGGQDRTATRSVTLTMSSVATTQVMRVSSAPPVAGAPWVPFQATYAWELEPGDGVKTVYAQFRAVDDSQSEIVSDTITLDTRAVISQVTEDTNGETLGVGDVIHFTITAGEPHGTAWVTLGSSVSGIVLYDDGASGDAEPDDGVYERDYAIEHGVEVVQASVSGGFIDDLGNEAAPLLAVGTVTIQTPPTAVTMAPPIPLSKRSIALSWSRNNDPDFERYKLYRSYVPGVGVSTQRRLIASLAVAAETEFTDAGLAPDSTYYYAVYAVDDVGLSSISNEVVGRTLANEPPDAVTLYAPWSPDSTSLSLSWSRSAEDDFMEYEIVGWEQDPPEPPNVAGKRVLARIGSAGETFYTHSSLADTLVYWYEVAVVDSFDARAVSNVVSGSPRPAAD
jgi:fibronectin type 3 domain-containing protein